jgi:hypothetical protein
MSRTMAHNGSVQAQGFISRICALIQPILSLFCALFRPMDIADLCSTLTDVGSAHFNDYVFEEMMDPSLDKVVQFVALRDDQLELRLFQVSAAEMFDARMAYSRAPPDEAREILTARRAMDCW